LVERRWKQAYLGLRVFAGVEMEEGDVAEGIGHEGVARPKAVFPDAERHLVFLFHMHQV
jgi:hypothetical protein